MMLGTTLGGKRLKSAFLCLFCGVLMLSTPFFVEAYILNGTMVENHIWYCDVPPYPEPYPEGGYYHWYKGIYPDTGTLCSLGSWSWTPVDLEGASQGSPCNYVGKSYIKIDGTEDYFAFERLGVNNWKAEVNCSLFQTYETCVGADCFWEYSLYYYQIDPKMTGYYCTEPYEPGEEQCGALFKCQYCMTQETCEEEVSCEWINRGFGNKCYLKEPIIPPTQVEWEVPELEDCEGLGLVETWLCEIKNFIAGIFMPSQEKINNLYNTFGAFKQKFPFNYVGAVSNFFSDIKVSLDTEKDIPVEILGVESNVSFAFFDKNTTIGGQVETFKNIWLDFTSLIIIVCWSVWLLNFIRRIFA